MKVDNIQPNRPIFKIEKVEPDNKEISKSKVKEKPAAIYEKSDKQDNIGHIYDKNTIDRLKMDSERTYGYLKRIVEEMLKRQGKTLQLLNPADIVKVDEQARLEAQELIGPDGELGVEAVSQRIADFAIAISGGDKSKLDTLRKAIDEGFKEAEKILGGLPDISRETHTRVMEKLDAWENEE